MRDFLKTTVFIIITALPLHFIWEMLQMPLYQCQLGFSQCVSICFVASLGDVVMTLVIFILIAIAYQDFNWHIDLHNGKYILAAVIGLLFAIIFEQFAVQTSRWEYSLLMPLIPLLKIGMSPALQMTLLTPLVFKLVNILSKNKLNIRI